MPNYKRHLSTKAIYPASAEIKPYGEVYMNGADLDNFASWEEMRFAAELELTYNTPWEQVTYQWGGLDMVKKYPLSFSSNNPNSYTPDFAFEHNGKRIVVEVKGDNRSKIVLAQFKEKSMKYKWFEEVGLKQKWFDEFYVVRYDKARDIFVLWNTPKNRRHPISFFAMIFGGVHE